MNKQLKIYPSEISAGQGLELHNILNASRAIFSADGQREARDNDYSDTFRDHVTSAPGGSFKGALEKSKEPGNPPLLRQYDHASARIPGFKIATVNLDMSYRAIDREIPEKGKHGEILILDKKTRYYEAIVRHQVNRNDPERPLLTDHSVPLEDLLADHDYRITERFSYSDNPEDPIEHTLGINASWYRALGELSVDDSLNRLSLHVGYILMPTIIEVSEDPSRTSPNIPYSISA